ncbi:hypothetical protein BDE02_18G084800, partial [Populus trichocarpa]
VQKKSNPIKKNKKRFLEKIVDYMKSDSYMFSPFISTPHIASKTSSSSTTVPTRKLTTKDNQSTVETSNVTVEDQFSELPEKCISGQQKFVHKETVKHMVYQSCRSSLSDNWILKN